MFRLDRKTLHYGGKTVLADVSLTIRRGERVSLLGRSGAGKSTLLQALYAARGDGGVALIPQETALVQTLSVFHNVYMGRLHAHATWYNLRNLVWPAAREIRAMAPLIESLGLTAKLRTAVGELSGGQRQRTAVGRAVHQDRTVLLGDEPVSAVDQRQARAVLELIDRAHETVVLAMHDVPLALEFSDRIIGLDKGRVVLDAPAADLNADELTPLYADQADPVQPQAASVSADPPQPPRLAGESY